MKYLLIAGLLTGCAQSITSPSIDQISNKYENTPESCFYQSGNPDSLRIDGVRYWICKYCQWSYINGDINASQTGTRNFMRVSTGEKFKFNPCK